MKKIISVFLSICIVLGVCGVSAFAQEDGTAKTVDKVEITVTASEFYSDIIAYDCIYWVNCDPYEFLNGMSLQKNIDGEWKTLNFYDSEPIGAGTFRIMFYLDDYEYDSGKVEPGVTHLYIDGVDCGAVDEDYRAYSQTFELTEDDKLPEPQIIDEILVEGFKTPAAGEKRQYAEDLKIICKGAEDANCEFDFGISETNLLGISSSDFETYSGGRRYTVYFSIYLFTYKYEFAEDCVLCLDGEKINLDTEETLAETSADYLISRLPGDLGAVESGFNYFIFIANVVAGRFRDFAGSFIFDTVDSFLGNLLYYAYLLEENLGYFFGLDELDREFFLV